MVQKSFIRTGLAVLVRIIFFVVVIFIGSVTSDFAHNFLLDYLHYQIPAGFFGFTFADWNLAWFLTSTFFGSLVFGTLGKKIDYIFIAIFITLDIWEWTGTENITLQIWFVLVAVILAGNIIGFALKLLRQRFLPKVKV